VTGHDPTAASTYNGGHDERVPARNLGQGDHSAVEAEAASPRVPASSGREVARPDVSDPVVSAASAAQIPHRWHRMDGYCCDDDGNEIIGGRGEWMLLTGESVCGPFRTLAEAKTFIEENNV
jgi:hypothetical protein